ncbi:glutathione-regulated potassium-efflux system [Myxococcus stipitatus DSM 14675]|uniref:Glutathione-regulated potassium-efflux system n=1 Tax=Myxococcus stipitatus (strain DSM 14675 / JCM 12634 / Mx s8) TaxID=1278073 RepID=L7UCV1_MYXSD|nr:glutathione-regulated potassium-efflux system [Myxococcus stipitatus DSM 14675]
MYLFASAAPPFLQEIVVLIAAGALVAYVGHRFRLVPIVGFLLAGALIGPNSLGLVKDQELVNSAAELGVILLLFSIGLEFSLEKLTRLKKLLFGGGGLQVGLASVGMMGLLMLFGVAWRPALFTGFLVALSSTAIVLKLLGDRGETSSEVGQVSLGLLIFQDLAVVMMVLLVPVLSGIGDTPWHFVGAFGKALGIIVAVLVVARRLMPRLLEVVARTCSPELFLLTVIAVCFGTAYLTSLAGVSVSLGAFLAGLVVSESRFSEHAFGEILPLQILFSATFFVSVGMLLDAGFLVQHLPEVLLAIVAVLLVKVVTTGISVLALGYRAPVAVEASLLLAQVGEFSFVLERSGRKLGLFPAGIPDGSHAFIAATVMLMVFTPMLSRSGVWAGGQLKRRRQLAVAQSGPTTDEAEALASESFARFENHAIVAGYGEGARRLSRVLRGSGIPFLVTTLSPQGANEAEAEGMSVLRGDYARQRTLRVAGVQRAKLLLVVDDDASRARHVVAVARMENPTLRLVARVRMVSEVDPVRSAGADVVVCEEMEGLVAVLTSVLEDYRQSPKDIEDNEDAVRRSGYAALRQPLALEKPLLICALEEGCLSWRKVTIRPGAPVVGESVETLSARAGGALKLLELRREGEVLSHVTEHTRLEAGDELSLKGSAEAFERVAELFRAPPPEGLEAERPSTSTPPRTAAELIDTEATYEFRPRAGTGPCGHLDQLRPVRPRTRGCEECLKLHDTWVHLRLCLTCGKVGCCDDSKNKHATGHFHDTAHPLICSLEPGEQWGWCYEDKVQLEREP